MGIIHGEPNDKTIELQDYKIKKNENGEKISLDEMYLESMTGSEGDGV